MPLKKSLGRVLRLALAIVAMLLIYTASLTLMGETETNFTPAEAARAAQGVFLVTAAYAAILSYLVWRSPLGGWRLTLAVFVIHVGVETVMSQIETLYFNAAVQMEQAMLLRLIAAGVVRALVFAPLVVLIWGKMRHAAPEDAAETAARWPAPRLLGLFGGLAVFYVVVYFLFGYFVAWQWEATRLYYTGSTAIKPFFVHFRDLFLVEDPAIIPFQLVRGLLWAGLAALTVRVLNGRRWESAVVVALVFVTFMALPLALFPNPYMPPAVAQSHAVEIASSMTLYGMVAGWVLATAAVPRRRPVAQPRVPATPGVGGAAG